MSYPYKLSVIVPCYNAEKYLAMCLDSLERQWEDEFFEIIFVNDCSTDSTIDLLRDFCTRHPSNTRLIDKSQNEGVGQARNDALAIAQGEWITFLDADDALVDGAYECLAKHFFSDDFDIISFRTIIIHEDIMHSKEKHPVSFNNTSDDMIEWEGTGKDFYINYLTNVCWIFCYKHQLIDKYNVRFKRMSYLEDLIFNIDVFLHDDVRVRRVKCQLHYWRTDHTESLSYISSSNRKRNGRMAEDLINGIGYLQKKKMNLDNQEIANRIERKLNDECGIVVPLLLRCNLKISRYMRIIKQLKEWNIYPYKGAKDKKSLFYNTLYHVPILIYAFRPLYRLGITV